MREQLKYNRYLANVKGIFRCEWNEKAIHYLQHGELHIDEVSGIFICSDGLFHPDWPLEQTVAYIRKNSINEYVAIIEELEGKENTTR